MMNQEKRFRRELEDLMKRYEMWNMLFVGCSEKLGLVIPAARFDSSAEGFEGIAGGLTQIIKGTDDVSLNFASMLMHAILIDLQARGAIDGNLITLAEVPHSSNFMHNLEN